MRRRNLRHAVISLLFIVASAWFIWGYRDFLSYVFSPEAPPLQLGNVSEFTPDSIAHNSYVELTGITEHRGLKQMLVRGLSFPPREFWYFRLMGSRGVFIEVPPDSNRYGYATELTVRGRAVDPQQSPIYDYLLGTYRELYFPQEREALRIIQVDVKPGEGRMPFVIMLAAMLGLVLLNGWLLVRNLKRLLQND